MKHKGLQRTFAFLLTLLVAFGSLGGFGLERSAKAAAPTITTQPQSKTVYVGETTTFSVVATGDNLTYQWQVKTNVSGADWETSSSDGNKTNTLNIAATTAVVAKSNYQFRCIVTSDSDTVNAVTSQAAILTVKPNLDRIAITTPPSKTTYVAGESFSNAGMVVTATYKDENAAETTAAVTSYTVAPSGALTASDDKVTVSYTENGVTKTAIQDITVNAFVPVTDITMTSTDTVAPNGEITLAGTVTPTGATHNTITWSLKDEGTATGSTVSNGKFQAGATTGDATITATVANGTATDDYKKDFVIHVQAVPVTSTITINGQPGSQIATAGSISGNLICSASILPAGPTPSYQWYSCTNTSRAGESAISSATSGTFPIPTTLTAGTYYYFCRVSATGAADKNSDVATVTVNAARTIAINTQPAAETRVKQGSITGTLSVAATVTPSATPTYQWFSCTDTNKTAAAPIANATNASYVIPTTLTANTSSAKSYYYFCRVSATGAQDVNSNVATVIVNPPDAVVTGVTITPSSASVARGAEKEFTAVVSGTSVSQDIDWGLLDYSSKPLSNDTKLRANAAGTGVILTVGMDEANDTITLRAYASDDRTKYKDVTVTVTGVYFLIKSTTPANVSVEKGTEAKLTCTVEKLTPSGTALAYQWYEVNAGGSTPISGATKSSYTLATTSLALGDYQFFCKVTGGTTELTSRTATVSVLDAPAYKVTSGAGGTYLKGGTGKLKFTVNGPYADFDRVVVDGATLTLGTNYTVESGSTVITLLNSYLKDLTLGKHTMYVYYDNGSYAVTSFYVNGEPYVWDLYADITRGNHVETTWLGKGETMRLTMYVANPSSTYVKWHYSSRRIGLSSTSTQLYYDSNSGYYVTSIDISPKYNGNVWVYAENSGETTSKHNFTIVGMNNLPATGQDSRPIRILIGISVLTAAALGALYVWKRKKAL